MTAGLPDVKMTVDDEKDDKVSIKEYFKSWAENSACDTFPQIPRSQKWPRRAIWIVIVLTLTGYATYEVIGVLRAYYSYPVNTNINYTYSSNLPFPAITLCNMNPMRKSKLSEAGSSFDSIFGTTNGVFTGRKKRDTQEAPTNSEQRGQQKYSFTKAFQAQWAQLSVASRLSHGHQLQDVLVACSMGGARCGRVVPYSSGIYGNCFSLNSGMHNETVKRVSKTGPLFGLTLELFLEDDEYLPELSEQTAARLHISDQKAMPFPEYSGFNVAPGHLTTIGLKMIKISRIFGYSSNCVDVDDEKAKEYSIYSVVYGVKYTREACYNTCYQRVVIQNCSCGDPDYVYTYAFFKDDLKNSTVNRIKPCISSTDSRCVEKVIASYAADEIACDCPLPCEEMDYQTTVSVSPWPSPRYEQTLKDSLKAMGRQDILNTSLERNLLKLEIYYDTLNFQHIYETPKYSALSLISDLGGQIGLWLGASLILVVQFFELIIDMMFVLCSRYCSSERKVQSTANR